MEIPSAPAAAAPPAPEQVDENEGLNAKEKAKKTIEQLQKGDNSISQEEEMSITGSNARFMIMQKLAMKDKEVRLTQSLF